MRTLVLLRHLKSSWDEAGLADHDRPLAPRGHRAGGRIRRHLEEAGIAPELVLCSSAVRAVETWESVRDGVPGSADVEVEDGLYGASSESLLARLNGVPGAVGAVLLIAHNPGIENLALGLAGSGDAERVERMDEKYPTGGLATLRFAAPWAELTWGGAELVEFVVPREL